MDLAGRPLITHTIRFALEYPRIRRVLVTTDARPIADVTLQMGAEVVQRPAERSTDVATTSAAVEHAITSIGPDELPEAVATLQPTSPLRLPEWLDRCADALTATGFDSAITLSPAHATVGSVTNGRLVSSNGRCTAPVMMTGAVDRPRPLETPRCQARRSARRTRSSQSDDQPPRLSSRLTTPKRLDGTH